MLLFCRHTHIHNPYIILKRVPIRVETKRRRKLFCSFCYSCIQQELVRMPQRYENVSKGSPSKLETCIPKNGTTKCTKE